MTTQNAATAGPELPNRRVIEREAWSASGVRVLVLGIGLLLAGAALFWLGVAEGPGAGPTAAIVAGVLLVLAGVQIIESRLTRLSYAPEIAQAMLRQQQANAVVGARQRIVEGAVGMVQLALQRLQEESVVELDEERKAAMVSNLLVVLCTEQATQPVVNTGSLYQ